MGRKNKNKKSSSSGQGTSSQDVPKPLSKEAKKEVGELIKSILESMLDIHCLFQVHGSRCVCLFFFSIKTYWYVLLFIHKKYNHFDTD